MEKELNECTEKDLLDIAKQLGYEMKMSISEGMREISLKKEVG